MEDGEENLETVEVDGDGPMVSEGNSNVEESSVGDCYVPESESQSQSCELLEAASGPEESIIPPMLSVKSANSDTSDIVSAMDHDSVQSCEEGLLASDSECETPQKQSTEDPVVSSDCSHPSSPITNDVSCSPEQDPTICNKIGDGGDKVDSELSDSEQEEDNVENEGESKLEPASALWPVLSFETRTETANILQEDQFEDANNSRDINESNELEVDEKERNFATVDGISVNRTECEDVSKADHIKDDSVTSLKSEWDKSSLDEEACHNGESISRDSMLSDEKQESHLSVTPTSPVDRISDFGEDSNESSNKQACDNTEQVNSKEGPFETEAKVLRIDNLSNVAGVGDPISENIDFEAASENTDKIGSASEVPEEETVNSEVLWDGDELKDKSASENSNENRCNGDIDSHEHSPSEEMDWAVSRETPDLVQQTVDKGHEENDCTEEIVTGNKRKHNCDCSQVLENSDCGVCSSPVATKMFRLDHNFAQLSNQQASADKGCAMRTPQVHNQQSVGGSTLFPCNTQANSHLTEYAQYLGLQPTVKFKCVRCGEKSFPSMMDLKTHQYACLKNHTASQPSPALSHSPPFQTSSTNFRITRKVYLCSVCGTYYENWNLFLHMREVHKRHICLFCLGMFSQAERLAAHIISKHNIVEGQFDSAEEFRVSCKGSVFLMCCSCEKVFSEGESFSNHPCKEKSVTSVSAGSNNSLVSKKSQGSNPSHQSTSTTGTFTERPKPSKQFADIGGLARSVNPRPVENKLGKVNSMKGKSQTSQSGFSGFEPSGFGSSNFSDSGPLGKVNPGRPKQILKVKIPIQPKKQENISVLSNPGPPATPVALSSSAAPNDSQPPVGCTAPNSDIGSVQTFASSTSLEVYPEGVTRPDTLSSSQENGMSNLDRTINAVALGITSEALEWQQRKDEEMREVEEPSKFLSLDGATKSDSDSDGESMHNYSNEENVNCLDPPEENGAAEKSAPSSPVQSADPIPVEHTATLPELSDNMDEEMSDVHPDHSLQLSEAVPPEMTPDLPQEAFQGSSNSAPPSPPAATTPTQTEPTPAEDESDLDTDDSDKLSLVVDETPSGAENEEKTVAQEVVENKEEPSHEPEIPENQEDLQSDSEHILNESLTEKITDIPLAGEDVPLTDLIIQEPVEDISVQSLLKECVKTLCVTCVYCSHARRIAVNGKQLALHTLAEHRFSPVDGTDKDEPPPTSRLISKLKDSLQDLQDMFFNTDTYDSSDKSLCIPYDRTYECFQCHFFTKSHKELYIHNRKMHQKTILLCIMCKSNFYSYSELLCHLCPGIYIPQCSIGFHCCMCEVDTLPSAFRLMVHLRKKHHTCDVCLEVTDDQQKLSSHVWKHKLHHLCYRCGIAYRNKPDITNHLYWKHGTESVSCKKCLQKKWPHVYHFCVPPATFSCEECNFIFTRAVSLRVHKRLHSGEQPHECTECEEKFISKRLLAKHMESHRAPLPEEAVSSQADVTVDGALRKEDSTSRDEVHAEVNSVNCDSREEDKNDKGDASDTEKENAEDSERDRKHGAKKKKHKEKEEQKQKKVVDVYDLPPLNLSSESDSSDEDEKKEQTSVKPPAPVQPLPSVEPAPPQVDEPQAEVVDGIWDKFQSYKASLEKLETAETMAEVGTPLEPPEDVNKSMCKIIFMDHDYCLPESSEKTTDSVPAASVLQDSEKHEESNTDPANIVKSDVENTVTEEIPPSTPPHSKDDSKSILSSESPSKKKRSPKKKIRRRSSSSSSNSSSGSDSSSCSCGTNCSCSSSSSSDSSSSSSDSDSSSSESKRRALERRESRKDKSLEKKNEDDDKCDVSVGSPPPSAAAPTAGNLGHQPIEEPHIDVMEPEPTFRESDLDTTESDTDEDFYDERPQKLADESQAEKRNLLLLASVAPLNNGAVSPSQVLPQQNEQLEQPPQTLQPEAQPQQQLFVPSLDPAAVTGGKKKTKKRKKKQTSRFHSKLTHKQAQLPEIPVAASTHDLSSLTQSHSPERFNSLYLPQNAPSPVSPAVQNYSIVQMTPPFQQSTPVTATKKPIVSKLSRDLITNAGSGSETEGRTKRKRMPNKFYGYSSDEETEEHHTTTTVHKSWRKAPAENPSSQLQSCSAPSISSAQRPLVPTLTLKHTIVAAPESVQLSVVPSKTDSDSDSGSKRVTSSSSSSDSDDDAMHISEVPVNSAVGVPVTGALPVRESNDNLYCYCQCPYDEVSEMIACDGKNCAIEWFHFECVGIMVPPKGQWYCPDCRKNMTNYLGSE